MTAYFNVLPICGDHQSKDECLCTTKLLGEMVQVLESTTIVNRSFVSDAWAATGGSKNGFSRGKFNSDRGGFVTRACEVISIPGSFFQL